MSVVIEIKNVSKEFFIHKEKLEVLRDISFCVEENNFISIVGPSGCGKTTLLKLIGCLMNVTSGEIFITGNASGLALGRHVFGFVFQEPALLAWRTARKNVELPGEILNNKEIIARSRYMLQLVGLEGFDSAFPRELSEGMKARIAIARALSFEPSILLMDEPFGALDEITRDRMNLELLRIWKEVKHTIIFVTHSTSEAIFLSDKIVVLSKRPGRIMEILDVRLPRPREANLRYTDEFLRLAKRIRGLLNNGN